MLLNFILNTVLFIAGIALGGIILFGGRRAPWATMGIIALAVTAKILAVLVAGASSARDLIALQEWALVGVVVAVGVFGWILGRSRPDIAVPVIGFVAGADIALWLYDLATYALVNLANLSERFALITGLVLIVVGGLIGLWFVRNKREETLILISMIIGVELINDALGLSTTSAWSAIILLSLALAGLLVQFADYLRETKADSLLESEEHAISSVAYFQDFDFES